MSTSWSRRGEVDGYRVPPEEYYLRDPGLAPDELAALHLAARVVRLEGATEALWKLGGERPDPLGGSAGTGPDPAAAGGVSDDAASAPLAEVPTDPRLPALFGALVDRHPVAFRYPGGRGGAVGGAPATRNGSWTRSASTSSGAAGTSRATTTAATRPAASGWTASWARSRSAAGRLFERPEHPHPGVRLQPWELGGEPPVVGRLLVDAEQAPWAVHHVGAEAVEERRPDGVGRPRPPGREPRRLPIVRADVPRPRRGARTAPTCGPT